VTAALATLLILGLFVDGWNHINLQKGRLGSFFTPWHGLLYAGFTATASWVLLLNSHLIRRDRAQNRYVEETRGIALRYPVAVAGIALATVGLFGDLAWHSIFGEEQGVARVIGPFHIVLFAGAGLLVTGPLRSAWHAAIEYPAAPSWRTLLPALLSLTLVTAMAGFLFQWLSAFVDWDPSLPVEGSSTARSALAASAETAQVAGVARVLMTNLILMSAVLFGLRRWRLPVGSVTFLFTTVALLLSALSEFRTGGTVLAAFAGGVTADYLIARLRATPTRPSSHRIVAAAVPVALWSVYFAALTAIHGIEWPVDLAVGTICLSALSSLLVGLLVLPPAIPAGVWADGAGRDHHDGS
jgi:hypothetical protein